MTNHDTSKREVYIGFAAFFLMCFMAMVFCLCAVANRVEPIIFGMPFGVFWLVPFTK
jgi:hypothetical protein